MGWVYRNTYVGPDRRSPRFVVRFVERRQADDGEAADAPVKVLQALVRQGMRWVDHFNYFGPDRRGADFSFFFLERRRTKNVGAPPPLHTALRQLRVRVMGAADAEGRDALRERLMATAVLANAQGLADVAEALTALARNLDRPHDVGDPRPRLHSELNRVEAMLA